MKNNELDVCCAFGFVVDLLVRNIGELIEDVSNGCDIEDVEDSLKYTQVLIDSVIKKDVEFHKMLNNQN